MNPVRLLRMIGMVIVPIATVNSCSILKFNLKLFFALNLYDPVFKKNLIRGINCRYMGIFTFSAMSSSSSHPNFSQLPPGSECHYLRGENASLKMENQELTSTAGALFRENEDAKVLLGQKDNEIAQKDKKLEESEKGLRQSILEARAQKNQHDLDMQELNFKSEAALKKMQTQLEKKDKLLEKKRESMLSYKQRWMQAEKRATTAKRKADSEIAQLKTEKTICKQKGVDIDLLLSSEQESPPMVPVNTTTVLTKGHHSIALVSKDYVGLNASKLGVFEMREDVVRRRPTFKKQGEDEFLFYDTHGNWTVGNDTSKAQGCWMVKSKARTPDAITETWMVHDGSAWSEVPTAKIIKSTDYTCDSEDEDGENEAWYYNLTGEHEALCEDGSAVVIKFEDRHYVVSYNWYEDADDNIVNDEAEIKKASLGMLTNSKPPTDDDGDIEGDFVPKA